MSRKSNRNTRAPIGGASNPLHIDHTSGHKKSQRNQPRLDQSSNTYTESPSPNGPSPKLEGAHASRSTSSGDDADGDVSNADAAQPDEDSNEDEEGDAFAPSGPTEEHGDQAGHINHDSSDRESALKGEISHDPIGSMGKTESIEAKFTLRDSDDDVYDRVDLISDSEEDEPNVEELEERNIIESEEAEVLKSAPAYFEASHSWEGFELEEGLLLEDVPFFDERYGPTDSNILDSEMELFQSAGIFEGIPSPPLPSPSPTRRVRFKEPIAQLSNDSDMDSDIGNINDLFSSAVTPFLPSGRDMDLDGLYSDYEDNDNSSCGSSSGYENDYGDTTDEEDVPASATKRPQSLLRQPSLSSLEFEAQVPATPVAKRSSRLPESLVGYRRGPRMGTWIVHTTKPCAVNDSTGNSVTSTANASPTNSQPKLAIAPDRSGIDPSGFSSQAPLYELHDPVLGPGSDMAAVSAALPARHSRQPSGDLSFADSSVFFPMDAMGNVGSFFGDGESIEEDDDDDDALLNIHDFIDFGDDSSEDGDRTAGDDSAITSPVTAEGPGPVQPKTPSSDASNDLMKHFDRHLVSAFRRGQPHQQSQARPRHGNLSLNSYALKGGRQATANAPLGPQKKRKLSGSFNNRPSFGVPATKKRMMNHR